MKNKKIIFTVVLIAVMAMVMSGCSAGSQKKEVVRVGYVNILSMAPAVVAKEKGFFDKQGLQTKFYSFANGPALYKALSAGKLDIGYAGTPPAVNWFSRGAKFKVVAKVDNGKFGLLTKPGSGVTQPSDLKGKKIGTVVTGSGVDILLRGFLLPEAGLTQQDVHLVSMKMPNMEQSIKNGNIAAAVAGEPYLTFAELRGMKVVKELPDPGVIMLATDDFSKNHPDALKKVLKGHMTTVKFMNNQVDATAKILAKAYNVPDIQSNGKTISAVDVTKQALKRQHYAVQFKNSDYEFYQKVADADYKLKLIDKPFKVKSMIDASWLDQVK